MPAKIEIQGKICSIEFGSWECEDLLFKKILNEFERTNRLRRSFDTFPDADANSAREMAEEFGGRVISRKKAGTHKRDRIY